MKNLLFITVLIFLISGCIPKATHQLNSYDISVESSTLAKHKINKTLKVNYPSAIGAISGSKIYYKRGDITSYYLYSRWSSSLNKMVYKSLLTAMQNRYKSVVGYSSSANVDLILETEIIDFYHTVEQNHSYANIRFKTTLIDAKNGNIVKTKSYSYRKNITPPNAKNFAFSAKEILKEFVENID